jgi:hypothetical protein
MKRLALAALLALGATLAAAQAPVPPMDCGATPEYPGRLGSDNQKRTFDKAYRAYDKCVRQYVEDRKNVIKANEDAAARAIDEFNVLVMKMRADSGEDVSKSGTAPATPSSGSAPKKSGY